MEPDESIGVLIVDDHEVVRRGLLAFLDSEPDIEVLGQAGGGGEALELLASMDSVGSLPDVVVMDLQMAPIDGLTRRFAKRDLPARDCARERFVDRFHLRGDVVLRPREL